MIKKQIDLLCEFKKFTKEMEIPCIYGKQEHSINSLLFTSSPFSLEFRVNSNMIVVDFDSIYENEKGYTIYTASENHSRETEESYKYTNDKKFNLENLIHFFSYKLYRD